MKFCDKLLALRKSNNMSQEQLADKLNVSRQAVSKWESGASIPDMEKMMQLCKILNCGLEDLVDDGAGGTTKKTIEKGSWNQYYQEILDFITKTLNMFWSMRFVEKVKCLLEMCCIGIVLFVVWVVFGDLVHSVFDTLLLWLPIPIERFIYSISSFLYGILGLIIGAILMIHIFKIRYLDYFITIEDGEVNEKTIEEPIIENEPVRPQPERKFIEKKKNTIIIRDPIHTTYGFFGALAKIVVFFIKGLLLFLAVPCILCFVGLTFATTFSIWYIKNSVFFFGIAIAFLGALFINYLVLQVIYQFILEQKYNFKRIFIILISGFLAIGIGASISFSTYLTFTPVVVEKALVKTTKELEMKENMIFNLEENSFVDNVEWIVDENRDNILIEIEHDKSATPVLQSYLHYSGETYDEEGNILTDNKQFLNYYIHFYYDEDFVDMLNKMINRIKKKERLDEFYQEVCNVKIYTSSANKKQLNDNYYYYD